MRILGIDPGPNTGAYVVVDGEGDVLEHRNDVEMEWLRDRIEFDSFDRTPHRCAVEHLQSYGMGVVGAETFETAMWIGEIRNEWRRQAEAMGEDASTFIALYRPGIKSTLCHSAKAKDPNVRQAVLDLYGGEAIAIGGKKCGTCKGKGWSGRGRPPCPQCHLPGGHFVVTAEGSKPASTEVAGVYYEIPPGPLKGIVGHEWSALAVALTALASLGLGPVVVRDGPRIAENA